ncbi:MAG: metal-dependent hydrolase [Acidobacteriota bacterium]|nr:metal-dependent hydrolase [Acidobacteriota bacterium]
MDNATHTLTGLFLSRAGLNKFTPDATAILLIAANLPDIDIISGVWGAEAYLHWHRNLTHSLLLAPVLAFLLVWAFRMFRPRVPWSSAFFVALLGVGSHLALDLTNIYGIRLLLPMRSTWFHLDLTPVIDFWIWGVFGVCIAAPFLGRLVSAEIGAGRAGRSKGRVSASAALVFLAVYNGGRAVAHSRVVATLDAREYGGAPPMRVAAFPASMNPLHWNGLAETSTAYYSYDFHIPEAFDPAQGTVDSKAEASQAITIAAASPAFRVFAEFALYPLYRVTPGPEGGTRVELTDMRFGFTSTALLTRTLQVQRAWLQLGAAPHAGQAP